MKTVHELPLRRLSPVKLTVMLLLLGMLPGFAEVFPAWDVEWMCANAEAIIIGDQLQGDRVSVARWLKGAPPGAPATLTVRHLGRHGKTLYGMESRFVRNPPPVRITLSTRHFVAFLKRRDGAWECMSSVPAGPPPDEEKTYGSAGMIWLQAGICYRCSYLGPWDIRVPKETPTEEELFQVIKVGLRDAAGWSKALNTKDPDARARALAAYTMDSASPEWPRDNYRFEACGALVKLGATAVPALLEQCAGWRKGDSLEAIVSVFCDLGPEARAALPELVKLLKCPERIPPHRVAGALMAVGGEEMLGEITPFLNHPDESIRRDAETEVRPFLGDRLPVVPEEAAAGPLRENPLPEPVAVTAAAPVTHRPKGSRSGFWLWVTACSGVLASLIVTADAFRV